LVPREMDFSSSLPSHSGQNSTLIPSLSEGIEPATADRL
jgi:hypothetical protein